MNNGLLATLNDRLLGAAGLLLGHGHRESSAAVREAISVLEVSQGPKGEDLAALRAIRQYHYDQYVSFSQRAAEMEKKAAGRLDKGDSRDAFERTATSHRRVASQHLRFARNMNVLFPTSDSVL
jgi:acetoin utilization deacetylase AcuC-like enzyme